MVIQNYDTDVNKGYSIRGNAAILRCEFPSFVGDYLNVIAWHTDEEEIFKANDSNYGTFFYRFITPSASIFPHLIYNTLILFFVTNQIKCSIKSQISISRRK